MINDIADTLGSIWNGGERYLAATKVGFQLEQAYRNYRNQAPSLSLLERRRLLAQTHYRGAKKLTNLFHENGAIWVKLGQFLSSRSDILPSQYVMELGKLQDSAKPVDFSCIEPVLVKEWGAGWRTRFSSFEEVPVATASIAQVHKAVLSGGEKVAVKVQLPLARRRFRQDTVIFKMVSAVGSGLISQFDLKQVAEQIITMTMQELDFLKEEENHRKFAQLPHPYSVYVPKLYDNLSTRQVLVSEWIDGVKLTDYLNANTAKAATLLRQLLACYVQQITAFGVYHADPHPGNFLVMKDGRVAILDYGAIGELSPSETEHYGMLLKVIFGKVQSNIPLGELFRKAGFVAKDQAVFEQVAEMVLKENLKRHDSTDILSAVMQRMRDLQVTIPDSFVSLARVILTFGGLLKMYQVQPEGL